MKTNKTIILLIALLVIFMSNAYVVNAWGFSIGKYHIGSNGITKEEPQPTVQSQMQERTEERSQNALNKNDYYYEKVEEERPNLVNVQELISYANSDPYTTAFLKANLPNEIFRIKTESREAYLFVAETGIIYELEGKPRKYHRLKTTEYALTEGWNKVQNGEVITEEEFLEHVKVPIGLKMRLFYADVKSSVFG